MTELTAEDIEQDRLRASMTLSEWIHFCRTGQRIPPPDPDCRECNGTGHVTETARRGHPYHRVSVSGWCWCIRRAPA